MRTAKHLAAGLLCLMLLACGIAIAQDATVTVNADCDSTRFNLEPRLNAGPQDAASVDFLPNRVGPGVDLVVGAGNDVASTRNQNRLGAFDAYYVHRTGTNCAPNFEGAISITSINPVVAADAPRDAFFFADDVLGAGAVELARTSAVTLLSTTACPNGSQVNGNNPNCWPVEGLATFAGNNPGEDDVLRNSAIAVDPRTTGTGAGDVYVVAQVEVASAFPATSSVQLIACSNAALSCGATSTGSSALVSGTDTFGSFPDVHVRADGVITVSYWTFTKPFNVQPNNPINLKFVTCTPQGAPAAPKCSAPTLVATTNLPAIFSPAGAQFQDTLYPKHADRLNADGKTFTTFLVWDRCKARVPGNLSAACTKVDVVLTLSTNNGATWSAPQVVETSGHQFFGNIRVDSSTKTTNLVYYSTQEDQFLTRAKVRMRQIAPGSTTLGAAVVLTPASDPSSGIADIIQNSTDGTTNFGSQIGIAVAGTGAAGQSKVYVHYTSNVINGIYNNGITAPDKNNTLVSVSY